MFRNNVSDLQSRAMPAIVLPILLVPQIGPRARHDRSLPAGKAASMYPTSATAETMETSSECAPPSASTARRSGRSPYGRSGSSHRRHRNRRVAAGQPPGARICVGKQQIVAVEVLNEFAARGETSCLARRARATVLRWMARTSNAFAANAPLRVLFRQSSRRRR